MKSDTTSAPDQRERFIKKLCAEFDAAGANYVVLHDWTADRGDSDVDIAVDPTSLEAIDWIIRAGSFGRLLQRLDYDVPWCRYYVVESDEPGRGYRQIDVACDPWGIGRYGDSVRLALTDSVESDGLPVPASAAQTMYLALKRARKGLRHPGEAAQLRGSFERDPVSASLLLENQFGASGAALADSLRLEETDFTAELRTLKRRALRTRWKPQLAWRRLAFGAPRVWGRIRRPTGLLVAVVGPDGVGKSTLTEGLMTSAGGAFRDVARLHVGPGILPPPARLLRRASPDSSRPHARPPSNSLVSVARLIYLWLDGCVGWWPRISVPRYRSNLVLLERGWSDIIVDPRRYRVSLGPGFASRLGRFFPRPDLILFLDGDPEEIHSRKPELSPTEIDRQLRQWRELLQVEASRCCRLDVSGATEDILNSAVSRINDRLASRQLDISSSYLAWRALGKPARRGADYWAISRRGRLRWLLQAQAGAPGLLRTGIYRPARPRHLAAAASLDVLRATSRGRLGTTARLTVNPEKGLAPEIAAHLGKKRVLIAGAAAPRDRGERAVLSIRDDADRLIAFSKVAMSHESLEHERRVLEKIAELGPTTFTVPKVLASFDWLGASVLVLEPILVGGRSNRALGRPEVDTLGELSQMRTDLRSVLGSVEGKVPVHGDFAPWNSARTKTGRLAVWDWEDAHPGDPLDDYFHWQLQRIVLLSSGTVSDLVAGVMRPDPLLLALCRSLDVAPESAPSLLHSYLAGSAACQSSTTAHSRARVRAIALLSLARA